MDGELFLGVGDGAVDAAADHAPARADRPTGARRRPVPVAGAARVTVPASRPGAPPGGTRCPGHWPCCDQFVCSSSPAPVVALGCLRRSSAPPSRRPDRADAGGATPPPAPGRRRERRHRDRHRGLAARHHHPGRRPRHLHQRRHPPARLLGRARPEPARVPGDRRRRFRRAGTEPSDRRVHRGAHLRVPRPRLPRRGGVHRAASSSNEGRRARRCVGLGAAARDRGGDVAASLRATGHAAGPPAWQWSGEASAFAGFNYQRRKFFDFDAWESQNWLMGAVERPGPVVAACAALAMLTFEPFSLGAIGSPQVFQTGETYRNAPIIDYQHPHDLIMQLGADVSRRAGRATVGIGAALVGTPPIGPAPFMHRPSAPRIRRRRSGITISTRRTSRTASSRPACAPARGASRPACSRAGSPTSGAPTSTSAGSTRRRCGCRGRAAPGRRRCRAPGSTGPNGCRRTTRPGAPRRSSHAFALGAGTLAWTAAAGQNREVFGHLESYLLEATWRLPGRWAVYTRGELVDKDILDAGFHPIGVGHTPPPVARRARSRSAARAIC